MVSRRRWCLLLQAFTTSSHHRRVWVLYNRPEVIKSSSLADCFFGFFCFAFRTCRAAPEKPHLPCSKGEPAGWFSYWFGVLHMVALPGGWGLKMLHKYCNCLHTRTSSVILYFSSLYTLVSRQTLDWLAVCLQAVCKTVFFFFFPCNCAAENHQVSEMMDTQKP